MIYTAGVQSEIRREEKPASPSLLCFFFVKSGQFSSKAIGSSSRVLPKARAEPAAARCSGGKQSPFPGLELKSMIWVQTGPQAEPCGSAPGSTGTWRAIPGLGKRPRSRSQGWICRSSAGAFASSHLSPLWTERGKGVTPFFVLLSPHPCPCSAPGRRRRFPGRCSQGSASRAGQVQGRQLGPGRLRGSP